MIGLMMVVVEVIEPCLPWVGVVFDAGANGQ